MTEKISVCMATYNGEEFIYRQLTSILDQLPNKFDEVIVSDDGSSDNTLKIVEKVNDGRIKVFHSKAGNVVRNFENALSLASGSLIFLADQDDVWAEGKVETMANMLEKSLLVFSNVSVFENSGSIKDGRALYPMGKNQSGFFKNFIKNRFIGATMAFKRELLDYALPFPKAIPMHDVWLGLLAEYYGQVSYIEQPMIHYRRHERNLSETGEISSNSVFEKLRIRRRLFACLLARIVGVK